MYVFFLVCESARRMCPERVVTNTVQTVVNKRYALLRMAVVVLFVALTDLHHVHHRRSRGTGPLPPSVSATLVHDTAHSHTTYCTHAHENWCSTVHTHFLCALLKFR